MENDTLYRTGFLGKRNAKPAGLVDYLTAGRLRRNHQLFDSGRKGR